MVRFLCSVAVLSAIAFSEVSVDEAALLQMKRERHRDKGIAVDDQLKNEVLVNSTEQELVNSTDQEGGGDIDNNDWDDNDGNDGHGGWHQPQAHDAGHPDGGEEPGWKQQLTDMMKEKVKLGKEKAMAWAKEKGKELVGRAKQWWEEKGQEAMMNKIGAAKEWAIQKGKELGKKLHKATIGNWFKNRNGAGESEGGGHGCQVTMWADTSRRGRSHTIDVSYPDCTTGSKHTYNGKNACNFDVHKLGQDIGDDVESVEVSSGCVSAMFVDDDYWSSKCKDTSKDNVVVKGGSWRDLPRDLEDDVCRVVVIPY